MSARESIKHSFQCGLRGFHVHKEVWNPIVSEVLRCCHERKNPFDRYALAAMKRLPRRLADCTIGHLPREISRVIRFFLLRGGCCQRRNCGQKPPKIANCTRGAGNSNEIDGGDRRFRKE